MKHEPDFTAEKPQNVMALTVPIWAVWSIVVFFVAGTAYFITLLNTINGKLDSVGSDRWKRSFQREWAHRVQAKNPSMIVPDPDQIAKDLE